MRCMYCGSLSLKVINTVPDDRKVLRKRRCMDCGSDFYTEENLYVLNSVKGNGICKKLNELRRLQKLGGEEHEGI